MKEPEMMSNTKTIGENGTEPDRPAENQKRKKRGILLIVLGIPSICVLLIAGLAVCAMPGGTAPGNWNYDDPESLWNLAERTERYLLLANPDRESPARKEALQALEDIALLDVSDDEKARLIHERFPEESFWNDHMKNLLKEAESGDAEAQFRLGCVYLKGWGIGDPESDREPGRCVMESGALAAKWFRKAALQGHARAQFCLAVCYELDEMLHPAGKNMSSVSHKTSDRIHREWVDWLIRAGRNGEPEAFVAAAILGCRDPVTREELEQAEEALTAVRREAAERGDVRAMILLSEDISLPDDECIEWMKKAAELGSVPGMCGYASYLEFMMKKGAEEAADAETVKRWRQKAFDTAVRRLDEGDAKGLVELFGNENALFLPDLEDYLGGEDMAGFANRIMPKLWDRIEAGDYMFAPRLIEFLQKDIEGDGESAKSFHKSLCRMFAERGFFNYQQALAVWEYKGAPEEQAEAVRLFRKLAGFGLPDARDFLGDCYLDGYGVAADKAEAVKWLRKAANQRHFPSMITLSECLRTGDPPTSYIEALMWSGRVEAYRKYDSYPEYLINEILGFFGDLWRDLTR